MTSTAACEHCQMTFKLSNATLGQLPESILRPTSDRSALTPGIVHIGLGNFHRAHQAWYLHRLFQQRLNMDWAIVGAGVRPYDEQMRLKLKAQDYLTTLIELDPEGTSADFEGSRCAPERARMPSTGWLQALWG